MTSDMTSISLTNNSQTGHTLLESSATVNTVESSKTGVDLTITTVPKATNDGTTSSGNNFHPTIAADAHSDTVTQSPLSQTGTTTASSQTSVSGKRKQKLLWRDVNAPKAPLSAYLQFLNKTRETVRSQNPGIGFNEITKILGTMWSEMPFDKKQVSIFTHKVHDLNIVFFKTYVVINLFKSSFN